MDPRRGGQAAAALHLTHQQYNADIPARTAVRTQLSFTELGGSTTESLATHQVTGPPSPPAERAVHVVCDTPASQIHPSTIKDGSTPQAPSSASRSASPDKARTCPSLLGRSGTTTMPSGACRKWARVRLSWHEREAAQGLRGGCFPARIPVENEGGEGWDLNSLTHRRA